MNAADVEAFSAKYAELAKRFHSGNAYLDSFLKGPEALDDGYGKTYIFLTEKKDAIIGYYNISTGTLDQRMDSGKCFKIGGSVHINGFALDERFRGIEIPNVRDGVKYTIADLLLEDCIERIINIRNSSVGFAFITLCSTKEGYSLYKRNEFDELEDDLSFSVAETEADCRFMYLPIDFE